MSTRQFANTVFPLIILVSTSLVIFADAQTDELDDLPPVPTFKVPSTPEDPDFQQKLADAWRGNEKDESKDEQKDKTKEQTEKVADKPADIAPVEDWDELPPIPTYAPQSKPKDEAKDQSEKTDDEPEDKKRERLIKEAESGNADAAIQLANEAESNNFPETAKRWLKVAAEAGSGEAWYKLGHKAIIDNDDNTAFTSFQKAADAGYEDAKIYLAFGYIEGLGTEKDVEKGKALLQSVADSGNAKAICKLAMAYYHGIGFEKDEKKAIDMLSQLYQKETDDSALLESALLLVSVDEKRGIKLIDDLLDKLNESSNLTLEGEEDKASALMMSIAYHVLNNTDADKPIVQKRLCSLVEMCIDSQVEGVRKELIAGFIMGLPIVDSNIPDSIKQKLFLRVEQLAQDGDCNAMLWLAYLYLKGIGTEKNRPLFDYWLDRAAWAGNPLAQFYAVIFSKVENEYDNTKNLVYLKQSIEKGIFPAWCLYVINALRIEAKSPEAEIEKKVLEEAEKHINQLLKEKRDFQAKASGKDFVFHINNQYEKWGMGRIGGGIGGKLLDRQFMGRYYSRSVTPEDMEFLYAPNYYVNISDLAYAVAVYYQKKNSDGTKDKEKIRERFKTAIELGNNLALKALIEDYWDSDEDEKALETLKTALDDNLPWAYLLQFKYTCYNPDGTENFDQAFPYLQKAAEMNDKEANKFLGMCYVLGKGVKQDVEKGVKILEDNKVYLDLLLIYGKGLGVKRDEEKSKLYYARNFANANIDNEEQTQFIAFKTSVKQSFISENYEEMLISSKYREDSNKYFLKRMEKEGDALATVYLGMQKMDVNVKRALFRKAAQDGDMFVKAYAGYILLSICGGDEQLKQEALALLHKAAHAGQAIAMNGLGGQLCNDAVGENDPVKRAKLFEEIQQWLKQAADKGNMSAYLFITEAFINSGEQVDMEEYQRYLDRAIELNIPLAMELKAYYLISDFNSEEFHGFPPKAIELLQRAADLGSSGAIERLQKINNYQSDQTTEQNSWSRGTLKKDSDAREKFDDYMSNQRRKSDYGLPPLQNYLPDCYNNNKNSNDLIPQLNF